MLPLRGRRAGDKKHQNLEQSSHIEACLEAANRGDINLGCMGEIRPSQRTLFLVYEHSFIFLVVLEENSSKPVLV
jgi:hypothetical protein